MTAGIDVIVVKRKEYLSPTIALNMVVWIILFTKLFRIVPRILQNIINCNRLLQRYLT